MKPGQTIQGPLSLDRKAGFIAQDKVMVKDSRGDVFYVFQKPGEIRFNLPPGQYTLEDPIKVADRPWKVIFKGRRKRERFDYKLPDVVNVSYGPNIHKASINLESGNILIDNSFKDADSFTQKFIKYHEIGHYFYKTEEFCDEYAQERMLEEGYNLSQLKRASMAALHADNPRQHFCESKILNSKVQ